MIGSVTPESGSIERSRTGAGGTVSGVVAVGMFESPETFPELSLVRIPM